MFDKYLRPRVSMDDGGSSAEMMAGAIADDAYWKNVEGAHQPARIMLESSHALVRGLGAVTATVLDIIPDIKQRGS